MQFIQSKVNSKLSSKRFYTGIKAIILQILNFTFLNISLSCIILQITYLKQSKGSVSYADIRFYTQ